MDWALLETIRANTLSAGHPLGLTRVAGGKKKPPHNCWWVVFTVTITVVAFLLGRMT